ncbi:MAG: hypothetical protein V9F03_05105 [Microthrixaceae bacterium]
MEGLVDDLEKSKLELVEIDKQLARWSARAAGKRAEIARLQQLIEAEKRSGLPASRTEAIVAVLVRGSEAMSPSQITAALNESGRSEELRSVTATLGHLLSTGRVIRPGRGRYLAV